MRHSVRHVLLSGGADPYAVAGFKPPLVADFAAAYYRKAGAATTFSGLITHARASDATMINSSGELVTVSSGTPRIGHHVWNGSAWVNAGLRHESEARTQLLHTTDTLVTQSHTVTAVPHTLHFTGTGTVTLSGASTAGPLVGTGTGENNRVSLTFTPSAASLTLTVSGTVTDAQLEVGSTQSSYIPNTAGSGTVTRAAETLTIAAANLPDYSTAISIQMKGRMTYADLDQGRLTSSSGAGEVTHYVWAAGSVDFVYGGIQTTGVRTGQFVAAQRTTATAFDEVNGEGDDFSPGVLVPFNLAARHGSTFINGALDGTAFTADLTPTALADLSASDFAIAPDFMGTIEVGRVWPVNLGDDGLEAATT